MKASVYIATSLDGFIARENGDLDWLPPGTDESGEDYGYHDFISQIDCMVMGRGTFEKVLDIGEWHYGELKVAVLSSKPVDIPPHLAETVFWLTGTPQEIVAQLAERGAQHLYVDGGVTIQGFLAAGLIQELIITTIPVLIGTGIPLFGPTPHDIPLRHVQTTSYKNGMVQSRYEVVM